MGPEFCGKSGIPWIRCKMSCRILILVLVGFLGVQGMAAVTLQQLVQDAKLTPKKYAGYFSDFKYRQQADIQAWDLFLLSKSGDCDDYAILADEVLKPKGYTTRLISVRMPGALPHVVCYIREEKGYLDFNNRTYMIKIEKCGESLRAIAAKVAKSFEANWTSAVEFTYLGDGMKQAVATVLKTDPPDYDGRSPRPDQNKINF